MWLNLEKQMAVEAKVVWFSPYLIFFLSRYANLYSNDYVVIIYEIYILFIRNFNCFQVLISSWKKKRFLSISIFFFLLIFTLIYLTRQGIERWNKAFIKSSENKFKRQNIPEETFSIHRSAMNSNIIQRLKFNNFV